MSSRRFDFKNMDTVQKIYVKFSIEKEKNPTNPPSYNYSPKLKPQDGLFGGKRTADMKYSLKGNITAHNIQNN